MCADFRDQPEALFADAAWLSSLARRIVADAATAEDLAQETWLSVLRLPRSAVRSPRRFLAGVLRNRHRMAQRSAERRRAREQAFVREDVAPAAAEAFERAELGRELAALVLELEEPLRSAILLRFLEELPPKAVAERLGVPLKTVESRIARGLVRLRERWRARHGAEDADAYSALVLLARAHLRDAAGAARASSSVVPLLGVVLMNTKLVLAVLAVAGGALLWLAQKSPSTELPLVPDAEHSSAASAHAPQLAKEIEESGMPDRDGGRTALAGDARAEEHRDPATPVAARTLFGRVLDTEARALRGIAVAFESGNKVIGDAESSADGRFALSVPRVDGEVRATSPELVNLFVSRPRASSDAEILLVVAPHRALGGSVRDEHGAALQAAHVRFELPPDFRARFDAVLDATDVREWSATSDADGRFELERVPWVAGSRVVAALEGYASGSAPAPLAETHELSIVLEHPAVRGSTIAGRVVDPDRRAVRGAFVSLGERSAVTDAAGEFRLDRSATPRADELVAVAPGHLPGRLRASLDAVNGDALWPDWVELQLGGAPLSLAGVVVDEGEKPRTGLRMWIADPTMFGILAEDTQAKVEYLLASGANAEDQYSQAHWHAVDTDESGRFRIEGLLAREYRLQIFDSRTLEKTDAGPFAAGRDDLRIVFARGKLARLSARVISRRGEPLHGVHIALMGATYGGVWDIAGEAESDAEGRVAFEGIGGWELMLWVRGDDVIPLNYPLGGVPPKEIEITLEMLCHLKVDASNDPALADHLHVLDEEGASLTLHEIGASGVLSTGEAALVDGRSVTLGVSDTASVLVLVKDGVEVRRIPLLLQPRRLNVVTP